jgi:hypothetical protein
MTKIKNKIYDAVDINMMSGTAAAGIYLRNMRNAYKNKKNNN